MKILQALVTVAPGVKQHTLGNQWIEDTSVVQRAPVVGPCPGYDAPHVVCVRNHGAVLPDGFERTVKNIIAHADTYSDTVVDADESFASLSKASFHVFNIPRALDFLGKKPSVDFFFDIGPHSHEAPVYIPDTNELLFSRIQHNYLPQLYVNLTADPPTLHEKIAEPPIYTPTGARYHNGLVYLSSIGGSEDIDGRSYRPGIYTLDPLTLKSKPILNNYYGYFFNGADDLDIDKYGIIYFTDNYYGRSCGVNDRAPQMKAGTYRFDPTTGATALLDDTLEQPNGVQLSLDGNVLYLTDTGAGESIISPTVPASRVPPIRLNSTGTRAVYAYDLDRSAGSHAPRLRNRDALHAAMDYAPDGIKIASNNVIVTASGHGVSVLATDGELLLRVQTNFTVINIAWAGRHSEDLWAVGPHGCARIRIGLRGPESLGR